jgi:hypothetical protein
MARHLAILLIVVIIGFGCTSENIIESQLSEEDRIHEAIFRYQFENNASGWGKEANVYFLSVGNYEDPSPELLEQFSGHIPVVKPVSASTLEPGTAQVLDIETGLPGLIFRVDGIRWLSDNEVEVDGGYDEASESATGNIYRAIKQSDGWEVVDCQMLWIK